MRPMSGSGGVRAKPRILGAIALLTDATTAANVSADLHALELQVAAQVGQELNERVNPNRDRAPFQQVTSFVGHDLSFFVF